MFAFETRRVKSSGSTIVVPDDFPTIQAAVNNASDGDTIFIRAGTYNEWVTVNKALTLSGENRTTTTISGVDVVANGSTIQGLTVEVGLTLNNVSNAVVRDIYANYTQAGFSCNSTLSKSDLRYLFMGNSSGFTITENVFDFADMPQAYNFMNIYYSSNNTFSKNTIMNGWHGEGSIYLYSCPNNTFFENNFVNNTWGVWFVRSDNNTFFHNNFKNNVFALLFKIASFGNVFDAGYPGGGNYYSDYSGNDFFSGVYQNETGSDGIGDTPIEWYAYPRVFQGRDDYPLMKPYSGPHDFGVLIKASKTAIAAGYDASVVFNATVINYGVQNEDCNFTFDILGTNYETALSVESRNSTVYQYTLDTTGFTLGNYTVWAYVSPVSGETDTSDNNFTLTIRVVIPGDASSTTPGVPDGVVNMKDIAYMVALFNTRPTSPNWDGNADVNNDGVCNMRDIAIAVAYFNQHE
jgi:parallel beta-helix repeat protein